MSITQSKLRELLIYDPETGLFSWRSKRAPGIKAGDPAGSNRRDGYLAIRIEGTKYQSHRLAWLYVHGQIPPMLDHINGDRSDNRILNLRPATNSQNCLNRGRRSDNSSGFKGVSFERSTGKWRANCSVDGKWKSLGRFETAEAASAAYEVAASVHHGEFKHQDIRP